MKKSFNFARMLRDNLRQFAAEPDFPGMPDPEHVAELRRGVRFWNDWRRRVPEVRQPELGIVRFPGADLAGIDLRGASLSGSNLRGANLTGADLRGAHINTVDLHDADLSGADLRQAYLRGADLRGANLRRAKFWGVDGRNADFRHAAVEGTELSWAQFDEVNFSDTDLTRAAGLNGSDFTNANLANARLRGARLREAILKGSKLCSVDLAQADLDDANLIDADLSNADLSGVGLSGACLRNANLQGSNLRAAWLFRTDFQGANLCGVDLSEARLSETVFANACLATVTGLESCAHHGPSTVDHRTLQLSGPLPVAFLRGCGLPDEVVQALNRSTEFFSCFISYSSRDEEFVRRLYSNLQNKGVRCWFADEDIKGGEKLYEQITRAIESQDKLLLVLSENSIDSDWVVTEVRKARELEKQTRKRKLFPIRLLGMEQLRNWVCFDADSGKDLAAEVREYFIPDFSEWQVNDSYERSLDRLFRDLREVA